MSFGTRCVVNAPLAVPLLPVIVNLRRSNNLFEREVVSRTITAAFYLANLLEVPLQVTIALGKLPFTAVRLVLGSAATGAALGVTELRQAALIMGAILLIVPESMHDSLGMKKVGQHLRRAAFCVVIVIVDSLRAIANPDNLIELCVARGIYVRPTLTSRVKDFVLNHRKELFFTAGGILVGFAVYAIALKLGAPLPVTSPDSIPIPNVTGRVWSYMSGSLLPGSEITGQQLLTLTILLVIAKLVQLRSSKGKVDPVDSTAMPKQHPVEITIPKLPVSDSRTGKLSSDLMPVRRPSIIVVPNLGKPESSTASLVASKEDQLTGDASLTVIEKGNVVTTIQDVKNLKPATANP